MDIKYWINFKKRVNSTKRPDESQAVNIPCVLKENTSIYNPTFIFNMEPLAGMNYLRWDNLYYFVRDIVVISNALCEVYAIIDPMATAKDDIGASSQFISRAASAYDTKIQDPLQVIKGSYVTLSATQDIEGITILNPHVIYSIAGVTPLAHATKSQYLHILDKAGYYSNWHYNNGDPIVTTGFSKTEQDLLALTNPQSYFSPARIIYVDPSYLPSGASGNIQISSFYLSAANTTWEGAVDQFALGPYTLAIPDSPYTDWRAVNDSVVNVKLFIPGVGNINLPARYAGGSVTVYCKVYVASVTMAIEVRVTAKGATTVESLGVFSVPIGAAFNSATVDAVSGAQINALAKSRDLTVFNGTMGIAGGIVNAISGITSGVSGIASGIGQAAGSSMSASAGQAAIGSSLSSTLSPLPNITTGGGAPSIVENHTIQAVTTYYLSTETDVSKSGKPLHQTRTINTLSGFVSCIDASIELPGFEGLKNAVISNLNGGFFYE